MRTRRRLLWMLLVAFSFDGNCVAASGVQRPLEVEDVLRIEWLPLHMDTQSAFSPDGEAVVFAALRSQENDPVGWTGIYPEARHSDLWLQSAAGLPARQITHGETDSSGWFDPQWSPSGRRLLMKSTRGGDVHLWVWERVSGSMREIEGQSIEGFPDSWRCRIPIWLDDSHILFCALPSGVRSLSVFPDAQRLAEVGWSKAEGGVESSYSILTSGARTESRAQLEAQLLLLDIETGDSKVLVEGGVREFSLSRNRKLVALVRADGAPRVETVPAQHRWGEKDRLEVIDLEGHLLVASPATVSVPFLGQWSPSGDEIAFWALDQAAGRVSAAPILDRADARNGSVRVVNTGSLDGNERVAPEWASSGTLVINARHSASIEKRSVPGSRADWYLVKANAAPKNLTAGLALPPRELNPGFDNRSFVGAADGKLWRITPNSNVPTLVSTAQAAVSTSVGTAYSESGLRNADLIVQSHEGVQTDWYALRGEPRLPHRLSAPAADAKLAAYSTPSGSALFFENSGRGTFIWRTQENSSTAELLRSSNTWVRDIEQGQTRRFAYTSLNGEKLSAWLILPIGYQSGRRYPTVCWVYSGSMAKEDTSGLSLTDGYQGYFGALFQILASKGYAVLVPSMPRKIKPPYNGGDPDDVLLGLTNGVLPAVDAAVTSSVADPERLFVAGQSFGGYSTYGLVTQTNRFKAAIAMAGLTDLISYWGTVQPQARYSNSFESMQNMTFIEAAQPAMIRPPWKDLGRYIRNSPISYVEQVETPLLMIHGDMDAVPLAQAEEFFGTLFRQGKAAQLVRYWGEGHIIQSPANFRDMWNRIFAWFDEYGDIERDEHGNVIFDGDHVKSRSGSPGLKPQDFVRFDKPASHPRATIH